MCFAFLADHCKIDFRPEGAADSSEEENILRAELVAIMEERGAEEPIQEAGTIDGIGAGAEELLREAAVDELAEAIGMKAADNQEDEAPVAVASEADGGGAGWLGLGAGESHLHTLGKAACSLWVGGVCWLW